MTTVVSQHVRHHLGRYLVFFKNFYLRKTAANFTVQTFENNNCIELIAPIYRNFVVILFKILIVYLVFWEQQGGGGEGYSLYSDDRDDRRIL